MVRQSCPKGTIKRNSYTTSSGKHVKESCIVAQSDSGKKTSTEVKKLLSRRSKQQQRVSKRFSRLSRQSCGKGKILRVGYVASRKSRGSRKSRKVMVKPTCITSRRVGASRKGTKAITIMNVGVLEKFGYYDVKHKSAKQRRMALKKALHEIKPLSVFRRVVAIATLNKNTDPKLHDLLMSDANWIKEQPEYGEDREMSARRSRSLKKSMKSNRGSKK